MHRFKVILVSDAYTLAREHRAGIKTDVHEHNSNSGLLFTVDNGSLHRCRTAVLGKIRAVNVYTTVFRIVDNVLRQYLSVRRNDYHIGRELTQQIGKLIGPQAIRLIDRYTALGRPDLDRRRS